MKLSVTKTGTNYKPGSLTVGVTRKAADVELPARGFIETKDVGLHFFTNSAKTIVGLQVTLAGEKKMFKDDHPFILWAQAENAIEAYLNSTKPEPKTEADPLLNKRVKRTKTK